MATPLSDLVRRPTGTTETYVLNAIHEKSYFLKKLSTYALRASAKVDYKAARVVWDDSDIVSHMIVVKVMRSGRKRRRPGRKKL